MELIKKPDVANSFYPGNPNELIELIDKYIQNGVGCDEIPKAIIAPHAGYIYSGEIAGSAYKTILKIADQIENVIIFSPAHRYSVKGIATHEANYFETPIGKCEVNRNLVRSVQKFPWVNEINQAFTNEHALEVHLPFVQKVFNSKCKIVPMIVGNSKPEEVFEVINLLWATKNFFIISSDLSHFLNYDSAKEIDTFTSTQIESLNIDGISSDGACGFYPLRGLLYFAKKNKLKIKTIDLRNSGDTAGDKNSVVGYGAYIIY